MSIFIIQHHLSDELSLDAVRDYVKMTYSDLEKSEIILRGTLTNGTLKLCAMLSVKSMVTGNTKKKKELIPTDSQLFVISSTPIQLEPSLFDGKEEVEKEDIIKYARENISPIFKEGRCDVVYFKEEKFVYLTMKGSTKGAGPLVETQEEYQKMISREYAMFCYKDAKGTYRLEKNPCAICCYDEKKGEGKYYTIPESRRKLPYALYQKMFAIFQYVAEELQTEVLVRLFWNSNANEYEIHIPLQRVSGSRVNEQEEDRFGLMSGGTRAIIGEFHSHCRYDAFFSSEDNEDEGMAILYGVFGHFLSREEPNFILRSFSCGNPFFLSKEDVFDMSVTLEAEEVKEYLKEVIPEIRRKVVRI